MASAPQPPYGIGHNSAVINLDERRAAYISAITAHVERVKSALTRAEMGALPGLDRLVAHRQALLDNTHQFYKRNPHADADMGVLLLITIYSDNSDGCCSIGAGRIAKFLSRHRQTVVNAIQRLEADECIQVERQSGDVNRIWPVVNRLFAQNNDPIDWAIDAHAPSPVKIKSDDRSVGRKKPPRVRQHGQVKEAGVSVSADRGGRCMSARTPYGKFKENQDVDNRVSVSADRGGVRQRGQVLEYPSKISKIDGGCPSGHTGATGGATQLNDAQVAAASEGPLSIESRRSSSKADYSLPPLVTAKDSNPTDRGVRRWESEGGPVFKIDSQSSADTPTHLEPAHLEPAKPSAEKRASLPAVVEAEIVDEGPVELVPKPVEDPGRRMEVLGPERKPSLDDRKRAARRFPESEDERRKLAAYAREYALSHGMDEATFRAEVKQWHDRAVARDERYVDWGAAWRTWVANWTKWQKSQGSSKLDRREGLKAAFAAIRKEPRK